jgi:hypothetical protein
LKGGVVSVCVRGMGCGERCRQHEDDVGSILIHAAELEAEGRVEVPANILRAHLRMGAA